MRLYFSPLACSMATRIALYEADADASFVEVDAKTKRTLPGGGDFTEKSPLGLVPTLETDDGQLLTENAAILQWVADRFPKAALAPQDAAGRTRLVEWLSFIGTELHKAIFAPLLDKNAPEGAKAYALGKVEPRFRRIERHLEGRPFLLPKFSVADAYLVTVLTWTVATPIDLKATWPALAAYVKGVRTLPSVAKAFAEERELYAAEMARAG
jgi:glutathione S-transferase